MTMRIPVISPALVKIRGQFDRLPPYPSAERGLVTELNREEIARLSGPVNAALADVNGKASAFTVSDFVSAFTVSDFVSAFAFTVSDFVSAFTVSDFVAVRGLARRAEKQMAESGVPLDARQGARLVYRPAGPAAKSYKYAVITTQITLDRASNGRWYLTGAEHAETYPAAGERFSLTITPAAREAVIAHALKPYGEVAP